MCKLKLNDTKETMLIMALCKFGPQPQLSEKEAEVTRGKLKENKGYWEYLHFLVQCGWSLSDQPGCF